MAALAIPDEPTTVAEEIAEVESAIEASRLRIQSLEDKRRAEFRTLRRKPEELRKLDGELAAERMNEESLITLLVEELEPARRTADTEVGRRRKLEHDVAFIERQIADRAVAVRVVELVEDIAKAAEPLCSPRGSISSPFPSLNLLVRQSGDKWRYELGPEIRADYARLKRELAALKAQQ